MKFLNRISIVTKGLWNKRRRISTLCLCVTLAISAALLISLGISFAQHLQGLDALRESYDVYINSQGLEPATQPFRTAVRNTLQMALTEIVVTHVLLLLLWLLISAAGIGVVLSEAVGSETYIYALYVLYGADPQRMRKQMYGELGAVSVPSWLLGMGMAALAVSPIYGKISIPLWIGLEMLSLYALLIVVCGRLVTKRLFKQTCAKLLEHADTSAYIHSPRKSRVPRKPHKQGGFYYATLAFFRMRKYHFVRAVALSLVAATLFVLAGLTLPDVYATEDIAHEFTLTFSQGVDGKTWQEEYLPSITYCDGVVSATGVAGGAAHQLGTHILLEEDRLGKEGDAAIYTGDKWAYDSLKIACADGDSYIELGGQMSLPSPYDKTLGQNPWLTGYPLDALAPGTAVYVYPKGQKPTGITGQFVDIFLPDGKEGYDRYGDHITVEVVGAVEVTNLIVYPDPVLPFSVDLGPRITQDYLFVSPADYGTLVGDTYTQEVDVTPADPQDMLLEAGECYLLLPPNMTEAYGGLDTLTLITPEEPFLEAFSDGRWPANEATYLPMDTYAVNKTIRKTGVYLGSEAEFLSSEEALLAMSQCIAGKETSAIYPMACTEYRVKVCRGVEGVESPCVVFAQDEHTTFATWDEEMTYLLLGASAGLETTHAALYFATAEGLVLQTAQGDALRQQQEQMMYVGTGVQKGFMEAMKKANIPLKLPDYQYKLTQGNVSCVFGVPGSGTFLLWHMNPTANLALDHYPPVFTGANCYVPVGDLTANSIISPSELDMMLVTDGGDTPPRPNATRLSGNFAYNDFVLSPDFEMPYVGELSLGQGFLLLPAKEDTLSVEAGEVLQVGIYQPLQLSAEDPEAYHMDAKALLQAQLDALSYTYHGIRLTDVQTTSQVTKATLVLSEYDFCQVLDRVGAVREIAVYVDAHIALSALGDAYDVLRQMETASSGAVQFHGRALRSQATGTQNDVKLLHRLLSLLVIFLPVLLLSSVYTLSLRRKEEWQAFVAAGGTRRRYISMCLWEGGLRCVLYGLCYLILCPLVSLFVMVIGGKLHMPFVSQVFSVENSLGYLVVLLLSVGLASLWPLGELPLQLRRKRKNIKGGRQP